jgi:hypothetical protein
MTGRRSLPLLIVAVFALGVAGCGDDSDDDSGDDASAGAATETVAAAESAGTGLLFTHSVGAGTLEPSGGGDEYTLTLTEPAERITSFTDRPVRSADTETVQEFVDSWEERGFADDPPNAALVIDSESSGSDTAVFEVADPSYDSQAGTLTYTAKKIESDQGASALPQGEIDQVPESFEEAHLFIDPSAGAPVPLFFNMSGTQSGRMTVTFDAPWTVIVGDGDSGISIAGGPGGGSLITNVVTLTGPSEIEFAVSGGNAPVTGTASVPGGAKVVAQAGDGKTVPIRSGKFSLSP